MNSKKIKPEPLDAQESVSAVRRLPKEGANDECMKVYCRVRPLEEN